MALTQVKTLGIADDAVTEAKVANDAISPTEMKAGTDGHIITYDASGNPTTVGPGTDGQVLTSTGAGSPPAFEDVAALTGSTNNEVVTVTGANAMTGESGLTFDGTHLSITDGDLVIGTSGHGIDFSATADGSGTMSSELFDDYEEGSWTPVLKDAASGGNTYSGGGDWTTYASYTKIGRMVHVKHVAWGLSTTGMTAGNQICVHGFPYAASGTHVSYLKLSWFQNFEDDEFGPYIKVGNGATVGKLEKMHNDAGTAGNLPINWEDQWGNSLGFEYYMIYHV